jgi:oligo-1,6-glucosidase
VQQRSDSQVSVNKIRIKKQEINNMEKKWWKESVVYQIYPKSFKDSNGDGIGDIRGIIQKLDYLKELGVNVLWISPMLESPQDDNGYDISDYRRIYKEYGTMEDYEELLSEAHKRDIRILMDLVVNHTSDEHNWFIESRKSKANPYRDYYIWKDPVNGKEPNNWGGAFGGSAWEYDPQTQMYYMHLFSKKQPDLNWENEKVRQEVYDMMKFWCDKGIDGFRMDVISMISKDQSFPDGEMNNSLYGDFGPYCVHGPRIHEFLQEMNREVLSKYDIMTVGETSGVTIEEAQKYAGEARNELNMVFQFEHVENGSGDYGKWTTEKYDFKEFKRIMIKWQEELQGKAWNSLFLGNHDQPRSVSRFGNDNPAYRETSAKMLATCLHMMQGTPYVYQGEELGMTNVYFDKLEDYRDIESINFFTELTESGLMTPEYMMKCLMLRSRDNARTPMQWDDSAQAGFTNGAPWIKVNPNYKEINAAQQLEDPNSIFYYYQKLIRLRKEKDIIVYGGFEPLYRDDEQIFAYIRRQDQEKLLTVCNFSDKNAEMEIPEEFKGAECLITNLDRTVFEGKIVLKPYEAFVLYKK